MLFEKVIEVLDEEPHIGALNMAIDEVLLRGVAVPTLRTYRWSQQTVSFGYFTQHQNVAARWTGRELVRRWTGGGIVLHGADVTYTLVVPRTCAFFSLTPLESYRAIHACIAELFGGAHIAPAAGEAKSDACFEAASQHDLLVGPRKVAGAAQRRTRFGLLHQGSIQGLELGGIRERLGWAFGRSVEQRRLTPEELGEAQRLAAEKYACAAWLRRL